MSARTLSFTPADAWFFRDGRPYHLGEAAQTDVRSVFPPPTPTVIGAVRAALAREQNWNGRGSWKADLQQVLGNGSHDLGALSFRGPFVAHEKQCLFPVPMHLLGSREHHGDASRQWTPTSFLAPSESAIESDLGVVRFPVPQGRADKDGQLKEPTGLWVTVDGYNKILRGELPEPNALFPSDALWRIEARVGLARDHASRSAREGELYSPAYVRLHRNVELMIDVEGIPDDWPLPELTAFGGESRLAYCEARAGSLPLPDVPADQIRDSMRFTVCLLSPLLLPANDSGGQTHPEPQGVLHSLAGSRIVSACVGKPIRIGGWNSVHREPEPLLAYLPAGSTWFCEVTRPDALDSLLEMHGQAIGDRKAHGLGQIAIGAWPTNTGDAT